MVTTKADVPKTVALVIGAAFLALGLLGLILNPTGGSLLGTFAVDLLHNIIHLVVGVAGIGAWYLGFVESRIFNKVLGVVYLVLGVLGFIPPLFDDGLFLGILHLNNADNILHLVVGAIAAYFGFSSAYRPSAARRILERG